MNPYAIPPLVSALFFIAFGLFVYFKNRAALRNRLFFGICLTTFFWQGSWFIQFQFQNPSRVLLLIKLGYTFIIFIPISLYHFAMTVWPLEKDKQLIPYIYATGLFFVLMLHTSTLFISGSYHYFFGDYPKASFFLHPIYLIFLTALVSRAAYLLWLAMSEPHLSLQQYKQRRLLLAAFVIFSMASVDFLCNYGVEFYPFGVIFILISLGIIGYSIARYHLMDIQTVIHKTAMWVALSSLIILPFGSLFYLGHDWITRLGPFRLSLLVASLILLLIPYIKVVQPRIDHIFQRRKHDLQKILQDFNYEISALKGLDELVEKLQTTITSVLYPEKTSLVLFDVKADSLKPILLSNLPNSFSAERHSSFLQWLERENDIIEIALVDHDPKYAEIREGAKSYFNDVQGKLVVPLTHDGKLLGVLNLDQKKNLKPYTDIDMDFLFNLKVEASISLSNSLLYDDVNKMSVELRQWATGLERKVEERTAELQESYKTLQEYDRLKSRFFANISHEFRTPLTLLMGPAETLLRGELGTITKRQEEYLNIIRTHSGRLLRLINTLLNLSKIDAKEASLSLERGNFIGLVREITNGIIPFAEKKAIAVSYEADETVPEFLYDPVKMEEVLFNLLSNALKFTEKGQSAMQGVTTADVVTLPAGEIRVSCVRQWNNVLVKIADTGSGIPQEALPKLFDRFYQVDTAASRMGAGTGLGLALAKEWVELHKGRIWVESEEGRGSVFFFTIPIRLEEVGTPTAVVGRGGSRTALTPFDLQPAESSEAWRDVPERAGMEHVLVVDDNPDMLHFIADQLRNDYNLSFANDGEEGIALARLRHPDLILSDIMMPVKDGYQLCRELKKDPQTTDIPIIFLTAKGDISDKIEGFEEGADDYLTKPFNQEELKARVRSLLRTRSLQKEVARTGRQMMLSEKMASLGLLMAGVAHEIRNPVSFSKGSLGVVKRYFDRMEEQARKDAEDVILSLDVIEEGLNRTNLIVSDLDSFIRSGEHFAVVDIRVCLDSTLGLLHHALGTRVVVYRDDVGAAHALSLQIEGIPGQINQALMNVLQNANQSIAKTGEIFITTRKIAESVTISIRDTGRGIAGPDLSKVFEPFYTTKGVGEGTGLGMAIVYKIIVENHHGKIDIKSKLGEGTEVMMTLPQRQQNTEKGVLYARRKSL